MFELTSVEQETFDFILKYFEDHNCESINIGDKNFYDSNGKHVHHICRQKIIDDYTLIFKFTYEPFQGILNGDYFSFTEDEMKQIVEIIKTL
ncbi:hypothetical protein EZS27_010881 [termite gut metagenome]|uniref:Uncharacterized protein n=1 Tax=termite gut metagenome TaxID=433724 RepID=A0A5J4S5D5_9ZZZZ